MGTLASSWHGTYVAVEVKRKATIEAVDQLSRYIEMLNMDGTLAPVRGILVALSVAPNAKRLAWQRGIKTVEVDYDELRGRRSDDLTLF